MTPTSTETQLRDRSDEPLASIARPNEPSRPTPRETPRESRERRGERRGSNGGEAPQCAAPRDSQATDEAYAFEKSIFSTYAAAHEAAVETLMRDAAKIRKAAELTDRFDGGSFSSSGLLDAPLELPRVLLLPSAPVDGLPALRSDADADGKTFACHTRPGKVEQRDQCAGDAICANSKCVLDGDGPKGALPWPTPHTTSIPIPILVVLLFAAPQILILHRRPDLRRRLARKLGYDELAFKLGGYYTTESQDRA